MIASMSLNKTGVPAGAPFARPLLAGALALLMALPAAP
jgi:hypothetical protein